MDAVDPERRPAGQGAFGLDSTAKVKSKGFPKSLLKVTEFSPGRSFVWEGTGGIAMRVLMSHVVEPADGGSRVTLSIIPTGPAATLMGWLVVRMSKANVNIEAESLKQRAEAVAAGS